MLMLVARLRISAGLTKVPINIATLKDNSGIMIILNPRPIKKRVNLPVFFKKSQVHTHPGRKKT